MDIEIRIMVIFWADWLEIGMMEFAKSLEMF